MQTTTKKSPSTIKAATMWVILDNDNNHRIFSTRDSANDYRTANSGWTYPEKYSGTIRQVG
jgi:hypothetical protein